ncbi:MAG: 2-oxo acid dehydrogenase subunit E2 [Erysipelotrichaceae bacterium]|nr:2-oxo acid dehydrogenase subunit E2 [Erysipelotrichaceae bacterium]
MRKHARRVDVSTLMQCCIDLKPTRKENEVYIDRKVNVSKLVDYMSECKKQGKNYTYFHAFLTAIAKVMYNRPKLNRFIANRHMYEHNDILLSFVAKISLDDKSEEMMLVVPIEENDNMDTIAAKTAEKVEKLRSAKAEKKGANQAAAIVGKLPNIIRVPFFAVVKRLGEYGLLPSSFTDNNIYFTSMIISNLGSIECGAIYHNLADFGTCSSLSTIGEIETERRILKDGSEEIQKVCHLGITLDERIADGFYFAKSVNMIEYILNNPDLLNNPVSEKIIVK